MKYVIKIYRLSDPWERLLTIEADGRAVVSNAHILIDYYFISYDVDASQYIKVWISSIADFPWKVEIYDENGNIVAYSDNVYRDNPLVYKISKPTTTTTTKNVSYSASVAKFHVELGGGWLPFVIEKELTYNLSSIWSDPSLSIEKAVLTFQMREKPVLGGVYSPNPKPVKVYCNDRLVWSGDYNTQTASAVNVDVPPETLDGGGGFRVEIADNRYGYCGGIVFDATLTITVSTVVQPGESADDAKKKVVEAVRNAVADTLSSQGKSNVSVNVNQDGSINVKWQEPDGTPKSDNWWGSFGAFVAQLPNIILMIVVIFILIEIIRAFR
jgi:hypothetical protein